MPSARVAAGKPVAAAAAPTMAVKGLSSVSAAAAAADSGSVVAALEAHGVVRVNSAITDGMASELLGWVNKSLDAALAETQGHEEFGEAWQARFGDVLKGRNRHDVKLSLGTPQVRTALSTLLSTLGPAIAASLGDDALLYELAALISLPGSRRQPVHADIPISDERRTDAGATILTAFCALQDIDATMGPTLFLPATHNAEAHADFFTYETFDLVFDSGDDEEDEAEQEEDRELAARTAALLESWSACRAELGAGDVALYDGRCLHAGDANTSPRQRVLFYCSFATAEHARTSTRGTILDDLRGKHALSDWREWTWSSSED